MPISTGLIDEQARRLQGRKPSRKRARQLAADVERFDQAVVIFARDREFEDEPSDFLVVRQRSLANRSTGSK